MIDKGVDRPDFSFDGADVTFRLQGTDLIGLMKNTNKKMGKR